MDEEELVFEEIILNLLKTLKFNQIKKYIQKTKKRKERKQRKKKAKLQRFGEEGPPSMRSVFDHHDVL
jgi:hypothetical protein